jgi:Spy/CpxP family protein refolding chaperone
MKRSLILTGLAAAALAAIALPASADQGSGPMGRHGGHGFALRHCLSKVDLTSDEKAAVDAIFAGSKSIFQADLQTLRSDHEKLQADIANGADDATIGKDTLTVHSDEAKLKSDGQSVKSQVLSKLTLDHQNTVSACLQAMAPRRSTTSGGASAQ